MKTLENRYEFVLLFDVHDGNPNGDPDADNMPRTDPETNQGLVSDVCLKRKVRNYVELARAGQPGYSIFVREKAILNNLQAEALKAVAPPDDGGKKQKGTQFADAARDWMCRQYFDVRTFGAVMSTGANCGQVRGPVQMTFARSIDSVLPTPYTITRMAVTTQAEADKQDGGNRTMGRKHAIPYGLFRAHGFISAHLAQQTGFSEDDLELFWDALIHMFDHDRSASRGLMAAQGLWIFRHENALGRTPAHQLFSRIKLRNRVDERPARQFTDYAVEADLADLPSGVTCEHRP